MPEPQQHDNDVRRAWMRQLERERLAGLSVAAERGSPLAMGEDYPGPGAAAASAGRQASSSESDSPVDWRRELERDRLSMQAVEGEAGYPGPGAIGAKDVGNMLKSAVNPAEAAKELAEAMNKVKENIPVLETRGRLWQMMASYFFIVPLLVLPLHKLWFDPKIKDVAIKVKQAVKKAGVPLPPQAAFIVRIAPWLPSIEWLSLLATYGLIALLALALLSVVGLLGCAVSLSCLKDAGVSMAKSMGEMILGSGITPF